MIKYVETPREIFIKKCFKNTVDVLASNMLTRYKKNIFFIRYKNSAYSGQHTSTRVQTLFKKNQFKKLSSAYKKFIGRGSTGTITTYSKGRTAKRKIISYTLNLKNFKKFNYIALVNKDAQSTKFAALIITAHGSVNYLPATTRVRMCSLMFGADIVNKAVLMYTVNKPANFRFCEYVSLLKFYQHICYISKKLNERVIFSKSSGSSSIILIKRKKVKNTTTTIKLPSGKIKIVDAFVIVLLGYILPKKKKTFKNTKAGY